jgi:hypothetical protein
MVRRLVLLASFFCEIDYNIIKRFVLFDLGKLGEDKFLSKFGKSREQFVNCLRDLRGIMPGNGGRFLRYTK